MLPQVPRPDGKDDGLGLHFLDEPSANQSDPTVLELQLRAKSKKLQYGDVAVRSIEHADKHPNKIEKWVNDIRELHRSKPPPQVRFIVFAWSCSLDSVLCSICFFLLLLLLVNECLLREIQCEWRTYFVAFSSLSSLRHLTISLSLFFSSFFF